MQKNKKGQNGGVIAVIVLLIVGVLAVTMSDGQPNTKIINTRFDPSDSIFSGGSTNLFVTAKNNDNKAFDNVVIVVDRSEEDKPYISIEPPQIGLGAMKPGEDATKSFNVTGKLGGGIKTEYTLTIKVLVDNKETDTKTVKITVNK